MNLKTCEFNQTACNLNDFLQFNFGYSHIYGTNLTCLAFNIANPFKVSKLSGWRYGFNIEFDFPNLNNVIALVHVGKEYRPLLGDLTTYLESGNEYHILMNIQKVYRLPPPYNDCDKSKGN